MKKELSNWNIAATHCFISCVGIPLFAWAALSAILLHFDISETPTEAVLIFITLYSSIYLGARFSAGQMGKKYIINDASEIVRLSTKYLFVFFGFILVLITIATFAIGTVPAFIAMAIAVIIFKSTSIKHIQQDSSVADALQVNEVKENTSGPK